MSHYDLDRMGWQQFEHLVQALAVKELGEDSQDSLRVHITAANEGREILESQSYVAAAHVLQELNKGVIACEARIGSVGDSRQHLSFGFDYILRFGWASMSMSLDNAVPGDAVRG
ncbi:MAG TPA: hypothetical protein VGN33_08985 [Leifsonia sp.]|nr:hypothetical protein [Leifsonia sp.]